MKKNGLVLPVLAGGLLGGALRFWRFGFRPYTGALLEGGQIPAIALIVLSVAAAVGIWVMTRDETGTELKTSGIGRLGQAILCAYLIYSGVWSLLSSRELLSMLTAAMGLIAAAFGLAVIAGWKGNHVPMCLYAVLLLIGRFRGWSTDPQLAGYAYQLLACVSLMLATYYRASFDMGMGKMKGYRRWSLLAAFFAMTAMTDPQRVFYGVIAFWLLTNQVVGRIEAPAEE